MGGVRDHALFLLEGSGRHLGARGIGRVRVLLGGALGHERGLDLGRELLEARDVLQGLRSRDPVGLETVGLLDLLDRGLRAAAEVTAWSAIHGLASLLVAGMLPTPSTKEVEALTDQVTLLVVAALQAELPPRATAR